MIRDDMTNLHGERTAEYRQAYEARDAAMANDRIEAGAPYRALRGEADASGALAFAILSAPCFSLRGGTREILKGIIARELGLR